MITAVGDICHFLPKFHTKLNPIEYFWAWVKNYFREWCNRDFQTSKKIWEEALNSCLLITICRFFRRSQRYMSVYRHGAVGPVAEYAVKLYCSHQSVQKKEVEMAEA